MYIYIIPYTINLNYHRVNENFMVFRLRSASVFLGLNDRLKSVQQLSIEQKQTAAFRTKRMLNSFALFCPERGGNVRHRNENRVSNRTQLSTCRRYAAPRRVATIITLHFFLTLAAIFECVPIAWIYYSREKHDSGLWRACETFFFAAHSKIAKVCDCFLLKLCLNRQNSPGLWFYFLTRFFYLKFLVFYT